MSKAVFITGAHCNTGYGIAEVFAKNGWDVFVTSRRGEEAEKAAKSLTEKYGVFAKGYECNIRNEQQIIDIFNDIDLIEYHVDSITGGTDAFIDVIIKLQKEDKVVSARGTEADIINASVKAYIAGVNRLLGD